MSFLQTHSRPARLVGLMALLVVLFTLAGCDKTGDMAAQPKYNPLSQSALFPNGASARNYPAGTVPYVEADGKSPNDPSLTGLDANGQPVKDIPVPVTKELVQLGQERFNIYCIPCHGPAGEGNGRVITFGFSKPPNLLEANAKALTNGEIFNIIENGRGKMFPYGYRVKADERWAVISYIRALQLKGGAVNPQDLTADQLNSLGKQP